MEPGQEPGQERLRLKGLGMSLVRIQDKQEGGPAPDDSDAGMGVAVPVKL